MTTCDDMATLIAERPFRTLVLEEQAALDQHLASCQACWSLSTDVLEALEEALDLKPITKIPKTYERAAVVEWSGPNEDGEFWVRFKWKATDFGYGLKGPFRDQQTTERCCDALRLGQEEGRDPPEDERPAWLSPSPDRLVPPYGGASEPAASDGQDGLL